MSLNGAETVRTAGMRRLENGDATDCELMFIELMVYPMPPMQVY